ncbi:hypothetical protein [Microbacterium sp. XT11]|uniref:hypothetical protein n=1 Tax=Microbacterium sp. XT11 TaxID=367477 RepID=UPI00082D991B|nr:hypothetical protein [Microbacterium sp. XT11]
MASIKITVSRGGYTSGGHGPVSVGTPDLIEIDVPVPDRADAYAGNFIRPADYMQLIGTTFDKTAELVDVVRGYADAEIADDEEVSA